MKFAVIGSGGPNSFAGKITESLKKLGHSVYLLSTTEIKNRYCPSKFKLEYHIYQKNPIDLREILPLELYDWIIISHSDFVFNNPKIGSTKVFYAHREMLCYPSCLNPDIIAYNHEEMDRFIWHYYPRLWHTAKKMDLLVATDPAEFNPNKEKDLKGLNYTSYYENVMDEKRDFTWNYSFEIFLERRDLFTGNGCRVNGGLYMDYNEYRDYLERSEAFLLFMGPLVFASRRLMECCVSKTLPVIHIENKESEAFHKRLGFEHLENCILFKKDPSFYKFNKLEASLSDNAYELVLNNHTYDHRAKEILEVLNDFK